MKQKNNSKAKIVLEIIIAIIILLCAIYVEFSNSNNNSEEKPNNIYSNLNIDKSKLNIFYLNVGQADSTLITMGEDVMLIDAGNEKDGKYITEFLKAQGIEQIDYLIETHSGDDHSGGIETIVNNLTVSNVYMPHSAISKSEIKDKVQIKIFSNLEQTYSLGNATWKVLSVDNSEEVKESGDNDTSIVIQLSYKDNKFLFMGDATSKVEKQLLNKEILGKIDVLKVGHHGSNTSSSENFLNVILPTYSIISVNNSEYSKHPSENTIERLNSINSKIYRTDVNGTIWITSDGNTIKINETDINVNGDNREEKLIGNRDILYFFILTYSHFHQQLCKHYLLIVNNFYNELLLELDLLLYIKIHQYLDYKAF